MNAVRLGATIRALRRRLAWRQRDLALRAAVSQQTVSDIEGGHATSVGLARLGRVAEALDAELDVVIRWRGGALDRLLDERHAALCSAVVTRLHELGWEAHVEVSYSVYGERGSIDVLGWHPARGAVAICEVKTELASMEATLRKFDEKLRLGPRIGRDRFGRSPRVVVGLLVLGDASTARRRVAAQGRLLDATYPFRGRAAWAMVAAGAAPGRGLVFLSPTPVAGGSKHSVSRVRRPAG